MVSTPPLRHSVREAVALSHPEPAPRRVLLTLRPTPEPVAYAIRSEWPEFVAGEARRTPLEKTVGLRVRPHEDRWHLGLRTSAPRLGTPDPTFFDEMALLLAELYADLVLEAAPTGQLLSLANQPEVRAAWVRVRQELLRRYPAPSELLNQLVAEVDRQLAQPVGLWPSLAYDYSYAALPGDFYQQPFETTHQYVGPKVFPQFFEGLDLHFVESRRLAPADEPNQAALRLTGAIDPVATDLAAVAQRIQTALRLPVAPAPGEVRLAYEATHRFETSTGLPMAVALTVSCTYHDQYRKEYHLAIEADSSVPLPHLP